LDVDFKHNNLYKSNAHSFFMKHKYFDINNKKENELKSYLHKNEKNEDISWLGQDNGKSGCADYAYFYIHQGFGIVIRHESLAIHGKSEEAIENHYSKLMKLIEEN
jgi:hypothetical protein